VLKSQSKPFNFSQEIHMQIKDLSFELTAEEQAAVRGGKLDDFLQNAATPSLLAEMKKQIVSNVLGGAVINNTGGNFAFSADVESNDTIDQDSRVRQGNRN
jgi:hypothetical protein